MFPNHLCNYGSGSYARQFCETVLNLEQWFIVGHPEPEKKSVGIFEYILASMLKVYLDVF